MASTTGRLAIAALRERGLSVSIDTLDPEHIRMADDAGVDYVLSLTPDTIELASELRATPVLIGSEPEDLDGLGELAAFMDRLGKPYLLDSILAPINSGFAASLARYAELRRRHPQRRDPDGDRQPDRADRGRLDGRHRAVDRLLPGDCGSARC